MDRRYAGDRAAVHQRRPRSRPAEYAAHRWFLFRPAGRWILRGAALGRGLLTRLSRSASRATGVLRAATRHRAAGPCAATDWCAAGRLDFGAALPGAGQGPPIVRGTVLCDRVSCGNADTPEVDFGLRCG